MKQNGLTRYLISTLAVLMFALLVVSCGKKGDNGEPAPIVPTPTSTAKARHVALTTTMTVTTGVISQGTAVGKLAVNMDTGEVGGAILYSGLSTSTLGGSIRDSAATGTPAIITLESGTGTTGAWTVPAGTVLNVIQLSNLANGVYHFRIDTVNNQSGEKRGDIVFPDIAIAAPMSPPAGVTSAGTGVGTLTANLGTGLISGSITFSGLSSNAVAAHIHQSSDNAVIITLAGGAGATAGTFTVPAGAFLNSAQLKALANDGLYFAVHTLNFQPPASELIGKIVYPVTTIPAVTLSGLQEVPPVTTIGSGTGNLTVNLGTGKISGSVAFSAPSIASNAHIHQGFAGENGSVLVTLTGATGLTSGTWTVPADTFLSAGTLGALISDRLYFNMHTASNANGEIRGQIVSVPTN